MQLCSRGAISIVLVICLDYTHLALHRRECAWLSRKQGCSCWLHKGRGCTGRKARSCRRRCVLLLQGSNHGCAARDPFHSSPGPGFARARVAALKGLVLWKRRPWGLRGGCFTFTPRALHGPRAIIRVLGRICISNNCFSKLQLENLRLRNCNYSVFGVSFGNFRRCWGPASCLCDHSDFIG